jgi:predicted phosphodiesterase
VDWPILTDGLSKIAVVSDIHGNAGAYREALKLARKRGAESLIILGDLLTYGCQPADVLTLTEEAIAFDGAILIKGNHDQLYVDCLRGNDRYYSRLQPWIRETVDWTIERLSLSGFAIDLPWREQHKIGDILFAHANPFGYGDWSYLDLRNDLRRAGTALCKFNRKIGVFGHTHRRKIARFYKDGRVHINGDSVTLSKYEVTRLEVVIANPGAIGQPRNGDRCSTMLFLESHESGFVLESVKIQYDRVQHTDAIRASEMSWPTKGKLLSFFE